MNDSYSDLYGDYSELFEVSSASEQVTHSMQVASMVLYSITCVLGIPGNAFVTWIAGVKMKRTVNTVWYVNLAVADLLCCLAIPFLMVEIVSEHHWPYGAAMCKILPTVAPLNMFASVFTLTLISLDRFTLIVWPVWAQNHRSISGASLLCGGAWLLALLLSMPSLIYRETAEVYNSTVCSYADDHSAIRAIFITRSLFGFLVPLLIMAACYLLIGRRVSAKRFKSQKALRIIVAVMTAFFVCWMPYHTLSLVMEYGAEGSAEVARAVDPLAIALAYLNSCLNPVLYVFMGQDFKARVRVSLRRVFENAFNEDDATQSSLGSKGQTSRVTNSSEAQV